MEKHYHQRSNADEFTKEENKKHSSVIFMFLSIKSSSSLKNLTIQKYILLKYHFENV